jgi:hypothetical protein
MTPDSRPIRTSLLGAALFVVSLLGAGLLSTALAATPPAPPSAAAVSGFSRQPPTAIGAPVTPRLAGPARNWPSDPPAPGRLPSDQPLWWLPQGQLPERDAALQTAPGQTLLPAPLLVFEGISNRNYVFPPDTTGDVGRGHYVQWVNLSFAVYDKAGALVGGPWNGNRPWQGSGTPCATTNEGDPLVLYDHLADRWVLSQFANIGSSGPHYQCVAVSQTGDPLGLWWAYTFQIGETKRNDYPKMGVWPDGYYMTANLYDQNWNLAGAGIYVFDRSKMLGGQAANVLIWERPNDVSLLPSDLDGPPPPAGAMNPMVEPSFTVLDTLIMYRVHADWSVVTGTVEGPYVIPVAAYDPFLPGVPQPGTTQVLDPLWGRMMYRLQYRNFGDRESLVANHTVNAGGGRAGIRWYEIRNPTNGTPYAYQQGTWAPADGNSRWVGSIAQDHAGNTLLGFSASSSTLYPGLYYAGRLLGDPPGELSGDASLFPGSGSQLGGSRWGDYSTLSVDPLDDCTFYYANEYYASSSSTAWQTKIGAIKFDECVAGTPTVTYTPSPLPSDTPTPTATASATPTPPAPTATATAVAAPYSVDLPAVFYNALQP